MERLVGIAHIAKVLVRDVEIQREQELKHLTNRRCQKPSFSYGEYLLGNLAEKIGCEKPTSQQVEAIYREIW